MSSEINHEYTNEIVCPYCGLEFCDSWEFNGGEETIGLIECGECEKHFYAYRNITVNYCTKKAKYGTCKKCNKEDTILVSLSSCYGKYEDFCVECGEAENDRLIKILFD